MPLHYEYTLHTNGRALWPEHKPEAEVLALKAITLDLVWSGTWQGTPTPEGGQTFEREWWETGATRYDIGAEDDRSTVVGRWISCDTALKDRDTSDWTALLVVELLADYRLRVRHLTRKKLKFPQLSGEIAGMANEWNADGNLRGILIEDRGSGTSAIQTLQQSEDEWIRHLILPFMPTTSKEQRAEQAAVWCQFGCVLLPNPSNECPWLINLTSELFSFPSGEHDDCVDAFSQIVLWLEHLLSEGYRVRNNLR
jgi:predicted phage terminase large subunit-like protein